MKNFSEYQGSQEQMLCFQFLKINYCSFLTIGKNVDAVKAIKNQ